ncbi:MAG: hypothetical protein IIY61_00895 [Ruminococcus sp.]|nr:hypothetical protein [Ruminococcus sp.]
MVGCPTCGAALRFDIVTQKMACDYCGGSFETQTLSDNSLRDDARASCFDSYVYICPSCGAELLTTDKNDAVGFCQYCGGASMIFDKMRQEWKPEHIIPFQVTKEDCKKAYCKEVRRHPFVSRKYSNPDLIESFRGIYMPYWSYRAVMQGQFSVRATSPRERISSDTYEIIHYDLVGNSNLAMEGYSRDASLSFDDDISESLAPYEYKEQKPFVPGYLSGFYAETGNVDPHEYDSVVALEMKEDSVNVLEQDKQLQDYLHRFKLTPKSDETKTNVNIESAHRTLNPVWFMSYRNGETITYAAVNGQTGKVSADLPLSPLRILLFALGLSVVIFGILVALMNIIPSIKANSTLGFCLILLNAGMYYLQNSFNRTIDRERESIRRRGNGFFGTGGYTFMLIVCLISFIAIVTDGSYKQEIATLAFVPLAATCVGMFICHLRVITDSHRVKKMKIDNESPLRVHMVQEAKSFLRNTIWLKIVNYLSLVLGVLLVYKDAGNNLISYGACFLAAAELFGLAIYHIRFQTEIAKRPLPQFNKKGARYDEN